jgi:deazaflavin-dependent oxidoreductase (nitroreductase family)
MVAMDDPRPVKFNAKIVAEFRARGGFVSGALASTPLMLVHHVGARSGVERVVPLAYVPHSASEFVIIASAGGSPTHPAWYHNLKANPKITVEVGTETFRVVARELDAAARCALWPVIVEQAPAAGEFQRMTARRIPLFILTREGVSGGTNAIHVDDLR